MKYGLFETNKDLQRFKAAIQQAKNSGFTDVERLLADIETELTRRFKNDRVLMSPNRRQQALAKKLQGEKKKNEDESGGYVVKKTCPICNSVKWYRGIDRFGGELTKYYWCKDCTYGEVVK